MSERSILSRGLELRPTRQLVEICIWSGLHAAVCLAAAPACAGDVLPSGGSVTAGSASIVRTNPSTLNINQGTNQAIINWNAFSVGRGDTVNFNQPGTSSATLNRVTGATPSWIAGTINAPGTVLLVNPNGIAITKSGTVNTGSFVGSTLDIKDSDFLAGHYKFSGNGASAGVINNGHINVSDGGFAALLGGQVSNNGVIAARLGKVGLGAGEQATLDLSGDGFLSVAVPSSELGHMTRADGALVSNKGKINADGGTVYLSAATASNILRNAVNMGGTIRANSVGMHDGRIVINGGGGNVNVTGKLLAKSRTGTGGEVDITSAGAGVKLVGALIDVSGKTGGGVVNIGGGPHATVALAEAGSVSIDSATTIRADATDSGDGGHIVIWSGGQTTAHGKFSAKGGPNGGNGGLVETSGHWVDFNNIDVNASAAKGAAGTWLVDPTDLTIDGTAATTIGNTLNGGTSVTLVTNADGSTSGPGTTSAGNGDIIFTSRVFSSNTSSTLTVDAYNDIVFQSTGGVTTQGAFVAQAGGSFTSNSSLGVYGTASITARGNITSTVSSSFYGGVTFTAGGNIVSVGGEFGGSGTAAALAGGDITINGNMTSLVPVSYSAGGNININYGTVASYSTLLLRADAFSTGTGTVTFANGANVSGTQISLLYDPTSYTSPTDYSRFLNGNGTLTAYMLVNSVANLQAINNNLHGNYALGKDINNNNASFTPIGVHSNYPYSGYGQNAFTGIFDGQGHVVSNLTSSLFGTSNGTIRNVGVSGFISDDASQILDGTVGGLVARNGGTIINSFSATSIVSTTDGNDATGGGFVGGLVGINTGTIQYSYATGNVTGYPSDQMGESPSFGTAVGGLAGYNSGHILYSYATGTASQGFSTGGLVGENAAGGLINYTYALGAVSNGEYVGGLVGQNDFDNVHFVPAVIENSYAAGHVSSALTQTGYINDPPPSVGGLVGNNQYGLFNADGTYDNRSAKVYWSIWNADTTGTTVGIGAEAPASTNEIQYVAFVSTNPSLTGGPYQNLGSPYSLSSYTVPQGGIFNDPTPGTHVLQSSFSSNWYMVDGSTMPFLASEWSTTIQNAHQLQLMDMNTSARYTLARNITYTNDKMWAAGGFSPIASFSGTLNGNGYTISSLNIDTSGANAGLFDTIASSGVVENLGIVNSRFYAYNASYAGALAGFNQGNIINTWVTGSAVNSQNVNYVGGLVGANQGFIGTSYADASVSGVYQDTSSPGWSHFYDIDGGLVGYNYGTIENAYAIGNVSGNGQVGGLAGSNGGTILNAYTTAQTFRDYSGYGINSVGPLVGDNYGNVYNSYWDSTIATQGANTGAGNAGTGLSTTQMQNINTFQSTYSGWDFERVWAPPSAGYYPQLYADSYVVAVWANSASMTYGSTVPTLSASVFGLRGFDPTSTVPFSGPTTSATSSSNAGSYAITVTSGNSAMSRNGNVYRVVDVSGALTINPVMLSGTVSINDIDKVYNGTAAASGGSMTLNSSSGVGITGNGTVTISVSSGTYALGANVNGNELVNITGLTTSNPNYNVSGLTVTGHGSITPETLTITPNSGQSKIYGTNDPTLAYTIAGTLYNGYSLSGALTRAQYGLLSGENVGSYAITQGSLTANSNYALTFTPNVQFAINQAALTITPNSGQSKTYGTNDPTLGYTQTGLVSGVKVDGVTITDSLAGALSRAQYGTSAGENVGSYAITRGSLSASSNYALTVTPNVQFAINQASLTVTPNSGQSKIYGTNDPTLSYQQTGLLQNVMVDGVLINDSLSGALSRAQYGSVAGENVGSYAITRGSLTAGSNYALTVAPNVQYAINQASLTITPNSGQSKTYGTNDPTLAYMQTGLVNGVMVDGVLINDTLTGALSRAQFGTPAGENVGSYAITRGSLAASSNYALTFTPNVQYAINQASLTITPNSGQSKIYGTNDPILTYQQAGLVNGVMVDGVLINDTLTGTLSRARYGTSAGENVGSYAITQGSLTANSNYSLAFTSGVQFAINKAALTITPNSGQSKIYGNNDPTLTYQQTGLVQNVTIDGGVHINDSPSGALSRAQYGTLAGENVGNYGITQGSLAASSNYALTFTPNVQYAINQASLTITPNSGQSKTYGSNDPTLTYTQTGLVNGVMVDGVLINDTLTGVLSRAQFGTPAGENVGSYAITQGTLAASSNYALTFTPNVQYAINQASLTFTPNGGQSKTYGTNDPTLTYTQTGLVNGVMVDGVLINDTLTGALSRAQYGTPAGENVGNYAITQGTLTANTNYSLAFTSGVQFAINKAALTITPDSGQSKIYGTNDPTLTYQQAGLVNGVTVDGIQINDSLTGALSRSRYGTLAGENVGNYGITQGSLAASSNYALTFTPNVQYAINQASLTITANDAAKTYGDVFTAFTYGQVGLKSNVKVDGVTLNDSINGVTMTSSGSAATADVAGSPYTITASNAVGSGLGNYAITYVNGALTVNPSKIIVSALGGNSVYGQLPINPGLAASPGASDGGLKNGQDVSVLTGLLNSFGITNLTNTGRYTLSVLGKLTNPNYVVTTTNSGTWTVTPATLTYVADPSTQFAGSTFSAFTGTVTGFVNGQNLASATTGLPQFTTPATAASTPGTYGIFGSGLTANFGNYVFAQAPGNATALTLNPAPANAPSQSTPPTNSSPSSQVGINFQNPNTTASVTRVSFTPSSQPGTNTASNQTGNNNDVNTTSLTAGDKYMHNGGRYFPPISQYDSEQYSDFKLPKFAPNDSQATVLTILARGIAQANAAKYMIDGFWNGEDSTWPGPGHIDLLDKATFSDGAGHEATPTNDPAFPIAAGKTDFAALLNSGPVMIGASADPHPVQWLLATGMAPDGKGIICDDTMTGKLVELSYDPATKTVGGITRLFDEKSNSFAPLADASNNIPASDASGLSGLQSFVPSTYFAVTVH